MKITGLIIPAAGLGTRMRAVSGGSPKEMLPIGPAPAIQHALYQGLAAGLTRVVIIIAPGKEIISRYLQDPDFARSLFPKAMTGLMRIREKMSLDFLLQQTPLGECDAISLAAPLFRNESVAVIYPDNIFVRPKNNPGQPLSLLLKAYERRPLDTAALHLPTPKEARAISNSGRVRLKSLGPNLHRITDFQPKGSGAYDSNPNIAPRTCGLYLAKPHYFDFIELARRESPPAPGRELTDGRVRRLMLKHKVEFQGLLIPDTVYDIGNPAGFALCNGASGGRDGKVNGA